MASIGSLSLNSSTDFTASRSFTGTSASDDYFDFSASLTPLFTELYLNADGNLTYSIVAPRASKSGTYTISFASEATKVEGFLRSGSSDEAYNGLSAFTAPGDFSNGTGMYAFYGTSGDDVTVAPQVSTKASVLQGWRGNDTLTGGPNSDSFSGGPGSNQMLGKSGGDAYRTKTSYESTDVILDDGTDTAVDVLQVLIPNRTGFTWTFERVGNDLLGSITSSDGTYNLTLKDQYIAENAGLEGIAVWAEDLSTGSYAAMGIKLNSPTFTGFAEFGDSGANSFNANTLVLGDEKTFYRAWGNGGNDELTRINDKDFYTIFHGGDGVDTVIYSQASTTYTMTPYSATASEPGFSVRNSLASTSTRVDSMTKVERFEFSDKKLAFDIDGNAGKVAKILGAVLGADSLDRTNYVTIGLDLLDGGMSYDALAALAVSVTGKSSSTDICNLLWANVIGSAPTSADIAPFKSMLDSGQISVGGLATLAADTSFNQTNIDLVGLATTGLAYA